MIYTCVAILLILYLYGQSHQSDVIDEALEKKSIRIVFTMLILLAALRYLPIETDRAGYVGEYVRIFSMSFSQIMDRWPSYFGYYGLSKIFSFTRLPYQFWFAFVELLYLIGFARLLNRFSTDKMMAIFIFFTCGIFSFSFHGLKQIVAMAFVWNALADFCDKRYIRAALFFLIAYYSHKSSLLFGFAFILWLLREKTYFKYLIVLVCLFLGFSSSTMITTLSEYLGDEHYLSYLEEESSYNLTNFFLYLILLCMSLFARNENEEVAEYHYSTGMAFIVTFLQLSALVVASAFRLGLYFSPFICILVSNNVKNNKMVRTGIILMLCIFMLYSGRNDPYKFFWQ